MSRGALWGVATLIVGLAAFAAPGVAQAEPPPPCGYTLSPPEVVPGGDGGSVVTATVTPACVFPGVPYVSVVCLQQQGAGPNQCTQNPDVAQIFAPYQPGATYLSSGRGCGAWAGNHITNNCDILGPISAAP